MSVEIEGTTLYYDTDGTKRRNCGCIVDRQQCFACSPKNEPPVPPPGSTVEANGEVRKVTVTKMSVPAWLQEMQEAQVLAAHALFEKYFGLPASEVIPANAVDEERARKMADATREAFIPESAPGQTTPHSVLANVGAAFKSIDVDLINDLAVLNTPRLFGVEVGQCTRCSDIIPQSEVWHVRNFHWCGSCRSTWWQRNIGGNRKGGARAERVDAGVIPLTGIANTHGIGISTPPRMVLWVDDMTEPP